jgi:ArsR family transcriptional regulator, arsenate/arsenite/antimonite-responsive transcriptional repressor
LDEKMMFGSVYKALADPTRRRVLQLLRERDMSAGELAEHFDSAWPTLSRHFAILREAELIQGEKRGASIIYSLNVSVLEEALLGMMEMFQMGRGTNAASIDRGDYTVEGSKNGTEQ